MIRVLSGGFFGLFGYVFCWDGMGELSLFLMMEDFLFFLGVKYFLINS